MSTTRPTGSPRPTVPPPAERARTLAGRARHAAVIAATEADPDGCGRSVPVLHHVPATGAATVQVPDDHPFVRWIREDAEGLLPAMLELTDVAPVSVRHPVRGLMWISGRLRVLPWRVARRAALRLAAEQPDERLLDVGHGATLLRLEPSLIVLSDAESADTLAPAAMAAARHDPVAAAGDRWLSHLAAAHAGVLGGLAAHLPPALREPGHRLVPLAVDRYGLRLRVEHDGPGVDRDVRLPFARPVGCPGQLGAAVRELAGTLSAPAPKPAAGA